MEKITLNTSSMTASQFWATLKTQTDAIAWNLLDAKRNGDGMSDGIKSSVERAYVSAECILHLVAGRMEDFKRQQIGRRVQRPQ